MNRERVMKMMEFAFWILCCAGIGYYADKKGRSQWKWGLAAALFSPIIVGIVLAMMSDKSIERDVAELRMGQEQLRDRVAADEKITEARFGQMEGRIGGAVQATGALAEVRHCPSCGEPLRAEDKFCSRCGEEVAWV